MEALFDADEIGGQLLVRDFRHGDRIEPLGMTGTRKVHDVFIDGKVPRQRRATWPIVETRNRILWIPGLVRSRPSGKLTSSQTINRSGNSTL